MKLNIEALEKTAEEIFKKEFPKHTHTLEGEGLTVSSSNIPEYGRLKSDEVLVSLKRYKPAKFKFNKKTTPPEDIEGIVKFLSKHLAEELMIRKVVEENRQNRSLGLTRSMPKVVIEDMLHFEDLYSYISVELLAAFEKR